MYTTAATLFRETLLALIPMTLNWFQKREQEKQMKQQEDRANQQMEEMSRLRDQQVALQTELEASRLRNEANWSAEEEYKSKLQKISNQIEQKNRQHLKMMHNLAILESSLKEYEKRYAQMQLDKQKFDEEIEKLKEEARKTKDMNKYKENRQTLFQLYLENVKIKLGEEMQTGLREDRLNVVVLGRISSGKSSLLNNLFGLKLKVGVGQTTTDKGTVCKSNDEKIQIWDCPGVNDEEYSIFAVEQLLFFAHAGLVLILYPDSIKSVKQFCQAMWKLKPKNTILVRTQCDKFDNFDDKSVEQELQADREILKKWNMQFPYPIFATSARKGPDFLDNQKLKDFIASASKI